MTRPHGQTDPKLPLAGRLVAVTRPEAQALSLCEAIRRAGGQVLPFPVLAIGAVEDPAALDEAIARLDHFDLAFFVSPNAVEHALAAVNARRHWPERLAVSTVGKGSERALREAGFSAVIAPSEGFDSEAVLALPAFSATAINGRRVVIFRGDGGRELLADALRARGAVVEQVSCYRRYRPAADAAPLIQAAGTGRLDALVLTSSEGVRNLVEMVGEKGFGVLRRVTVFAPHPRIVAHARAAGFDRVEETPPGDDGLLETLVRHFG
ncbi:HemD protein [Azoarcus olearius]|uniref:uroporphyrinogen-III synthase n=1 Tax=Azoarcus sp. (strain BH72) TaxID=418699 RepID=UPI0008062987|nr:uroporphyrinogen-III synthase [Azoarcus olearius]ANQ84159.1 HemD protein [Azoarcus olearius]